MANEEIKKGPGRPRKEEKPDEGEPMILPDNAKITTVMKDIVLNVCGKRILKHVPY